MRKPAVSELSATVNVHFPDFNEATGLPLRASVSLRPDVTVALSAPRKMLVPPRSDPVVFVVVLFVPPEGPWMVGAAGVPDASVLITARATDGWFKSCAV